MKKTERLWEGDGFRGRLYPDRRQRKSRQTSMAEGRVGRNDGATMMSFSEN